MTVFWVLTPSALKIEPVRFTKMLISTFESTEPSRACIIDVPCRGLSGLQSFAVLWGPRYIPTYS
ncbi:hypothetical protein L798_09519 [Zootermopsis nevadensis]|uniref:Uncharacterized protein n=1 Tax=Zootermopsis nevadensis TaxID=136037 RepID=A0A067R1T4_ZOONE|nr:hypothetical protein L798_09519 [Zootermopsis nevadensis]